MVDTHLVIELGTDLLLFNGLLNHLRQSELINANHAGMTEALDAVKADSVNIENTGLSQAELESFFSVF